MFAIWSILCLEKSKHAKVWSLISNGDVNELRRTVTQAVNAELMPVFTNPTHTISVTRSECTYDFQALLNKIDTILLDRIPISFIRKAERRCFRYMSGYRYQLKGPLQPHSLLIVFPSLLLTKIKPNKKDFCEMLLTLAALNSLQILHLIGSMEHSTLRGWPVEIQVLTSWVEGEN